MDEAEATSLVSSPTQHHPEPPKDSNTFPSSSSSDSPSPSNYPSFSALLENVVRAANSSASSLHPTNPPLQDVTFKGQFGMSHQEALASVTAKAAQVLPVSSTYSKPELSDLGTTSAPLPEKNNSMEEVGKKFSSNQIEMLSIDSPKTPNSDGYSWRKYGQKQVKSPESFRSYYRCTHDGCHAKKKVQHTDKFMWIIKVDYKDHHNHDPPSKAKEKGLQMHIADGMPAFRTGSVAVSAKKKLDLSPSSKNNELVMLVDNIPESEKSIKCHGTTITAARDVAEQHDKMSIIQQTVPLHEQPSASVDTDEHTITDVMKIAPCGKKRRMKDRARAHSVQLQKVPKETRVVVHTAGDVGVSADGYRWRKYGQKIVKHNINPRSYYRCSSAGCRARKHVEKATDNSTATMVTYEGKHDHDKPVPKTQNHTSPSSSVPCSATANGDPPSDSEKNADSKGTEKVNGSAPTLVSIGIELKSC